MPRVTIKVDDRYKLTDVAHDLRANGFIISESLENIGVLVGKCTDQALNSLRQVQGVLAIEADRKTTLVG